MNKEAGVPCPLMEKKEIRKSPEETDGWKTVKFR